MAEYEILLSGDCTHICRAMGWILEDKGYRVRTAPSPEEATEALVTRYYDLLIYVLILEDYEGIRVYQES